jgi:hypothetical protein
LSVCAYRNVDAEVAAWPRVDDSIARATVKSPEGEQWRAMVVALLIRNLCLAEHLMDEKTDTFCFECFPAYVCPEPVLVK